MPVDLLVIGLGNVGLPLAREAAQSGLSVVGIDLNCDSVAGLNSGHSHVGDIADADIAEMLASSFRATTPEADVGAPATVVICNPHYGIRNTPKVVGGQTPSCADAAMGFYRKLCDRVVRARSAREAEMAKPLENTYRHINITLVNEMAIFSRELDVDLWDAIRCAATEPFGFQPFYPGPGVDTRGRIAGPNAAALLNQAHTRPECGTSRRPPVCPRHRK